jgi:gamma-glutamylcysteine synthetase
VSARHPTAAAVEEQAELTMLRGQADETAADAARTLAELAGRLADTARPGAMARRLAVASRGAVTSSLRMLPGTIAGQRGAARAALAAIPALAVAAAVFLAYRRFTEEGRG